MSNLNNLARRSFISGVTRCAAMVGLFPALANADMVQTKNILKKATESKVDKVSGVINVEQLRAAAGIADLKFSDNEYEKLLEAVQKNLDRYRLLHQQHIANDVAPPFYFNPLVSGMTVNRTRSPLNYSQASKVKRPQNLEDVAYWPLIKLAHCWQRNKSVRLS